MKRITFLATLWLTFLLAATAQNITVPSVGQARLKVCGQNMHNYFLNLSNSFSECQTQQELDAKTDKIATVFLSMNADVYAMCELEVSDTVVGYLTRALNERAGETRYAYVHDGLEASQTDGATKVGFIYRIATVTPLSRTSSSSSGSNTSVYGRRMRWIGFKENATNEKFVVAMNHFKAKDSSTDADESQRMTNANSLMNAMRTMAYTDPDILVMGDLNCTTAEAPIQSLITNGGLTELLEKYDAGAYSYRYQGQNQLIDHALANASALPQITGAGLSHVATSHSAYRFSDHDTYLVGLNLGNDNHNNNDNQNDNDNHNDTTVLLDLPCTPNNPENAYTILTTNQGEFPYAIWQHDSRYGFKATAYTNSQNYETESDLILNPVALPANSKIMFSFDHTYRYTSSATQQLTLWVSNTTNSVIDVNTWTQLTGFTYSSGNNWTFVSSGDIDLSPFAGQTVRIGFHYTSSDTEAPTWEIRNIRLVAITENNQTALEAVPGVNENENHHTARKLLLNGRLYLLLGNHLLDPFTGLQIR